MTKLLRPDTTYTISADIAQRIYEWLTTRGGVFYWTSADLSDSSWTCWTPATDSDGKPMAKPSWKAADAPVLLTSIQQFQVVTPREVNRFHVAVRLGGSGLSVKLTDSASRRLKRAVAAAEERHGEAWYVFDYATQEAVVLIAGESVPLEKFLLLVS